MATRILAFARGPFAHARAYQVQLWRRRDHPVERVDRVDDDRLIGDERVERLAVVVERVRRCGCDERMRGIEGDTLKICGTKSTQIDIQKRKTMGRDR